LRSPGLEACTRLGLMMRSGLMTGNRLLFMTDEVTYVPYICLAFWPSLWIISKNYTASRCCAKSLRFRVHILRHNYNIFEPCPESSEKV